MLQRVPHHNPRSKLQPHANSDSQPQHYFPGASTLSEALQNKEPRQEQGNDAVAKYGVWVIAISENYIIYPSEHWKETFFHRMFPPLQQYHVKTAEELNLRAPVTQHYPHPPSAKKNNSENSDISITPAFPEDRTVILPESFDTMISQNSFWILV